MAAIPSSATSTPKFTSVGNTVDGVLCPECGCEMKWRKARATQNVFMGCSAYPNCMGSRSEFGIPRILNTNNESRLQRILKAAVMATDEECLTFTEDQLRSVDEYQLQINPVPDEQAYVVTVVKK